MYPLVSIAMATYNGEKYIDEQIDSIIGQTYKNIELIIVDDCSTDGTWKKLQSWQQQYPTVIAIYRNDQNIGLNKNFGKAFNLAKGEWVAVCDQDDIWYANKLECLMKYAAEYPDHILFHHNEDALNSTAKTTSDNYWRPYEGNNVNILFVFNRLSGHQIIFHSSLLKYITPIPEIAYDWWINVVAAIKGEIKYVPEALMAYRFHSESAYFSNVSKHLADVTVPVRKALAAFATIEGINIHDKYVLQKFQRLYGKHTPHKLDISMFLYFVKNRNVFFKDFYTKRNGVGREIFLLRLCRAFSKW